MTGKRSASSLASFTAEWLGADIRGLHALAAALYGYLPDVTGVTAALNREVSQLAGGDEGWRGPVASAFAAAWRRDAAAVEALAQVIGQTADVVDDLAVELAVIEKKLEEEAHVAGRYGVRIGVDGRPPPAPGGQPGDAAEASERHWARTYRRAYDRAIADAQQARDQAAGRLRDLYATITPGREPPARPVVGGPAGSIAGVTAAAVAQPGCSRRPEYRVITGPLPGRGALSRPVRRCVSRVYGPVRTAAPGREGGESHGGGRHIGPGAAAVRAGHRRLLSAMAAAGLLAVCGLSLSAGPARAEPPGRAQADLTPGPGEWWFPGWQVPQKVWPLTEGAGITVAEVDSGVQASVPDLRGVVLPGADLTGGGGNGDTDIQVGEDGHGTAMAVMIAGQGAGTGTVGIAPRARLLPVTVGGSGPASVATAAAGIRYAVAHGAQVIDMPFGIGDTRPASCDPVLQAAVAYALGHNVVLVASSGDASRYAGPDEPASCAGVLAVGGMEPGGSLWRGSTREPYVAVAAPGDHMVYVGRDGRYTTTGAGTSFSAALTAGAAALIRSRYPHMPWYEVDQRLIDTATPAGRPVPNTGYGYGIVNLARAVNASAYPVRASGPNPVYASFRAWLATPAGRAAAARYGLAGPDPAAAPGPSPAGMTLEEIVVTGVAAVCVFLAVLVFVLRMSSRRRDRRLVALDGPPHDDVPGGWEERSWSFGPEEGGEYGGASGFGRPPGYGPPPLWTESPYDPPAWR